jgi:hypothetical protein
MTGLLPLFKADEPRLRANEPAHLDFENLQTIDSIGAAIYLARTTQYLNTARGILHFQPPMDPNVHMKFNALGLLSYLGQPAEYYDLFTQPRDVGVDRIEKCPTEEVLAVEASTVVDRSAEISRVKRHIKQYFSLNATKSIPQQQLMVILMELVKNTLDHSNSRAYLGLHTHKNTFSFAYADTGAGIIYAVRKFWQAKSAELYAQGATEEAAKFQRLYSKGSFSDLIHWALQPGNSTKLGNGINFGFGLMMIVEAARNGQIKLAVHDADTYLTLTELPGHHDVKLSHSVIRQRCVSTTMASILLFHGELTW